MTASLPFNLKTNSVETSQGITLLETHILFWELVMRNMHNKFEQDTWNILQLSHPQSEIINVKCEKSQ